jgi:hypothetical protein
MYRALILPTMNTALTLPLGADRVRQHTSPECQRRIDARTDRNIDYFAQQPREVIERRMRFLDREWDVERVLETNASSIALTGVVLGATVSKKFLLLPATVLGFLLMHALQGWCPPLPLVRKSGVRTRQEIDRERLALAQALERKHQATNASEIGNASSGAVPVAVAGLMV